MTRLGGHIHALPAFQYLELQTHTFHNIQNSKVGEDYVPFIPKSKPEDEEQQKEEVVKKPKDVFSNEFDDILNELDEEDIAELASKYNCKEWEWIRAAMNSSFGIRIFAQFNE